MKVLAWNLAAITFLMLALVLTYWLIQCDIAHLRSENTRLRKEIAAEWLRTDDIASALKGGTP